MKSVDLSNVTVIRFECTKCGHAVEASLGEFLEQKNLIQHLDKLCCTHADDMTLAMHKDELTELARALHLLARISKYNGSNPDSFFGVPIRIKLLAEDRAGVQ